MNTCFYWPIMTQSILDHPFPHSFNVIYLGLYKKNNIAIKTSFYRFSRLVLLAGIIFSIMFPCIKDHPDLSMCFASYTKTIIFFLQFWEQQCYQDLSYSIIKTTFPLRLFFLDGLNSELHGQHVVSSTDWQWNMTLNYASSKNCIQIFFLCETPLIRYILNLT